MIINFITVQVETSSLSIPTPCVCKLTKIQLFIGYSNLRENRSFGLSHLDIKLNI